jgi:O-antigen/teichoic acid export membrane protein
MFFKIELNKIFYRIGINTFIQIVGKIISIIFSIFTISILTRYLGIEGYGKFTLVFAYLAFFGVLADFGLHLSMIKILPKYKNSQKKIIGSYFIIRILFVAVSTLLTLFCLLIVPYSYEIKLAIIIGIIGVDIGYLSGFGNAIFQSKLRIDLITYIDIIGKIITIFFIYIFIQLKLNIYFIVSTILMGNIVSLTLSVHYLIKRHEFSLVFDKKIVRDLLSISIPVGITSFFSLLYFKIDTLLLSFFKGSSDIAYYGVSYKIFENLLILWAFYMASAYPILSSKINKNTEFNTFLKQCIISAIISSSIIIVLGYILAPMLITIIAGEEFLVSAESLRILLFSIPIFFINNIFYHVILLRDKMWTLVGVLIGSLLFNIVINLIVIPKYSFIGTSYTTVITELFTFLFYFYLFFSFKKKYES